MISFAALEASASYKNPISMLHACHGKIHAQCVTLRALSKHLVSNGCDLQAQQAAQNIMRYFDTSGQFHHQDEEENLFPALRLSSGTEKANVDRLLDLLLNDHIRMAIAWNEVSSVLQKISQGENIALEETLLNKFISSYTEHIEIEEGVLFPLAQRFLTPQQTAQIGIQMAQRRGVVLA